MKGGGGGLLWRGSTGEKKKGKGQNLGGGNWAQAAQGGCSSLWPKKKRKKIGKDPGLEQCEKLGQEKERKN